MDINEAMKLSMERYDSTFISLAQYESMEKYCKVNNISTNEIDWESYSDEEKEYFRMWNKYNNLITDLIEEKQ